MTGADTELAVGLVYAVNKFIIYQASFDFNNFNRISSYSGLSDYVSNFTDIRLLTLSQNV